MTDEEARERLVEILSLFEAAVTFEARRGYIAAPDSR
jgi:hypothetical protein